MSWLAWSGLIGLAVLAVMLAAAALTSRTQTPPARNANRIPTPGGGSLGAAGYLDTGPRPQPQPLDSTGPMHALTLSEIWAGFDKLEREISWLQRAGDRRIGPTP